MGNSCGFIYYLLELYWQWLFIGQLSHFGLVGRQISLPRKEIAIPISFQMFFGSICINCFSTLFPSLDSLQRPILGATLITCKSAILPSAGLFVSLIITLADFLPIPLSAVSFSILSGIFSLD